jgi:hypothetical protein
MGRIPAGSYVALQFSGKPVPVRAAAAARARRVSIHEFTKPRSAARQVCVVKRP